jgi:hypothetical protein
MVHKIILNFRIDIEDMGLVVYTPLNITDPNNFIDPK